MLLERSGAERMRMGASMLATARALVLASVRERDPGADAPALRRALFLRFYGADVDPATRERIAARLGGDVPASLGGAPRRVAVDWGDLEMALTRNQAEWACYLDARSGEVQMVPVDRLGSDDDWPSEEEIDDAVDAGHLVPVEPLGSSVEYGWMAAFAATVGDARLRDRLGSALEGRGAFRRFKHGLLGAPRERERWFAFRDARLHEAARRWLVDHGIDATTRPGPPPGALRPGREGEAAERPTRPG
jgi:hypothetical protein